MAWIHHPPASHGTPTMRLLRYDRSPHPSLREDGPRIQISVDDSDFQLFPGEALALISDLQRALDDLAADPPAAWGPQPGYGGMTEERAALAHAFLADQTDAIALGVTADGRPCGHFDRDDMKCATVDFDQAGHPYLVVRPEDQDDASTGEAA